MALLIFLTRVTATCPPQLQSNYRDGAGIDEYTPCTHAPFWCKAYTITQVFSTCTIIWVALLVLKCVSSTLRINAPRPPQLHTTG